MGMRTHAAKVTAWVIAAAFLGAAGGIYGNLVRFIDPTQTAFAGATIGVWMILMALLGGKGTLAGPIVGAIVFQLTKELFWTYLLGWQRVALGVLIVAVAVFFPEGIVGFLKRADAGRARRGADAMTAMLELNQVTKAFGGVVANDGVCLKVEQGAIVGLIGPNGSGKTTLFNAITGTFPIDGGSIKFEGREISTLLAGAIARLGAVRTFQQPRIFRRMSVAANMLVSAGVRTTSFAGLFRRSQEEAEGSAAELLAFVGLADKRDELAGSLSFGQQKLLELAMALGNDPKLLLLDEPTAGINPALIDSLIDRLKCANRERGLTLLVIEHNMPAIMGLAEHIYCLAHGRLLAEGPPQEIQRDARVLDAYLGTA